MKYTLPLVLALAACSDGQVPVDTSSSGVSQLPEGCKDGDVLRFDSAAGDWFCEALPAASTPVGESEVDGFVANNGYALTSDLATVATTGDYADLVNIPPDADGLGELSTTCSDGQIPIWDGVGGAWLCMDQAAFLDTQLSESEVDFYVSNNGYATDADLTATLGALAAVASSGDFADLINVPPDADTLAALSMSCFTGQIAVWDGLGGAWVCTNQIVDTDVVLTEAEVDAFVANNGYATTADLAASLGGLAAVATTGDYADLLNIPADAVLGESEVDAFVANNGYADAASLAAVATTGDYGDLANTPAILGESEVDAFVANNGYALASTLSTVAATGNYGDLLNVPADAVLSEAEVDAYVANNGYADAGGLAAIATSADYADLINVPVDAVLGESAVEGFITNGPLDFDAGSTIGGAAVSTGTHYVDADAVSAIEAAPAINLTGTLSSQSFQVQRDILTFNTTANDATPIHIKTNIPIQSNVMFRLKVEGYNYGTGQDINSSTVGYPYVLVACTTNAQNNNFASGVSISHYCSSDGFVVVKLTAGSFYYAGFSMSAWMTNPTGNAFEVTGQVFQQAANL